MVAYGLWAWWANLAHGDMVAIRSGLVQGGYSLVLTFVMTLVTEVVHLKLRHLPGAAFVTTAMLSVLLFVSAYVIHRLVGTPEILMTILPGWVIGTLYTFFYILGLSRLTRRAVQAGNTEPT